MRKLLSIATITTCMLFGARARAALEPREIALFVNKNMPASAELARYYASVRQVPVENIIELDLPQGELVPFDQYESVVAQPLRKALRQRKLDQQIKCLLTLWGVPLRIAPPEVTPEARAEVDELKAQLQRLERGEPATRPGTLRPIDPAETPALAQRPDDPDARAKLRELARRSNNVQTYARLLQEQIAFLSPEYYDSAIDSELAMLWFDKPQRLGWLANPLAYPFMKRADAPRGMMVMRLDAPTSEMARTMIDASLAAERNGLAGKVVIDSRGIPARRPNGSTDGFGIFDEHLRNLAKLIQAAGHLEVVHDQKPEVIAPNSVSDVAVYVGWYSVGHYVPSMKFARGAVGFHVASFEMTSLRDQTNTGWARGLINDGVAATLGPVSEPLLHAFPLPDDFVPLLLCGKLKLAEVYWRTCPHVGWKMCMIGDPLYTPFAGKPALAIEQLPQRLRVIFENEPATKGGR